MSNPMLNQHSQSCNKHRADLFLNSDDYRLEDAELIAHLDSCEACRQYMDHQAAPREVWSDLSTLLKPREFDQASVSDFSAATIGQPGQKPVAAQDVLDALAPSDDPYRLGRLGNYEVTGVVGVGGMGVVLKAIDPSLDRVVAIKVMAPHLANNENARKRFTREAKAAAAVLHPNVIPIHSVASGASLPYLVMSYIRGGSLQKRLEQEGKLPIVEVLRIGSQIAAGLAAAHDQGLVHRDIKPENILMEDGVERVTITDFGLARAVDDNTVTQQGTIAGTPMYMSPEQARGEQVNQQSDLFSLGSVLYALCTGRPPYRAESSFGVMRKIIDESPTPIRQINPDVPSWLTAIIERLMSKDKSLRFQTAAEVHALLEACLSHVQQPDAIPLPKISGGNTKSPSQTFLKANKGKFMMFSLASVTVLFALATLQLGGFLNPAPSNVPGGQSLTLSQPASDVAAGLKVEEYEKADPGKHHWKLRGYNVGETKLQLLLVSKGESRVLREHIVRGSDETNFEVDVDFQIGQHDKLVMQRTALPELPMLKVHGDNLLTSEHKFTLEDIAMDISRLPEMSAAMSKDKSIPLGSSVPLYYGSYSHSDSNYKNDIAAMVKASLTGESFIVVALTWNPKKSAIKNEIKAAEPVSKETLKTTEPDKQT